MSNTKNKGLRQRLEAIDLARHAPPGLELAAGLKWYGWGLFLAVGYSLSFFIRYLNERGDLYHNRLGKQVLWEGAVMPDFALVLGDALHGFALLAAGCVGFAVYCYLSHRQGSKSIYTMRRLPDRWELHRRCLTLPAAGLALCAVLAFALLGLYYWIYMTATPAQCLTPDQWQKLWR